MTVLIPRNTTIPAKKSEVFSTAADNQPAVDVQVLQGERPLAKDNKQLGMFRLDGLPPAPRGVPQIEVSFDIDANGILNVTAKDKATGKEQKVQITASTNLDDKEVDRMVREAKQNEAGDRRVRELIETRNQADHLIYTVEKSLQELGDKTPAGDRQNIERLVNELKAVKDGDNLEQIKSLTEQLQQASHALSQQLYQQQAGPNGFNGNGHNGNGHQNGHGRGEDVIEGEFQEM